MTLETMFTIRICAGTFGNELRDGGEADYCWHKATATRARQKFATQVVVEVSPGPQRAIETQGRPNEEDEKGWLKVE